MTMFLRPRSWRRACAGRLALLLGSSFIAIALVAACGGDDDDNGGGDAGGSGGGNETAVIEVSASNIQFGTASLFVGADEAFTVRFDNRDDGVPHSFSIFDDDGNAGDAGAQIASTGIFTGPDERGFTINLGLPAGDYRFQCEVHASMTGTLNVIPGG